MKNSKTLKTFSVNADLKIWAGIEIKAESLEDALEQGRKLKELDFITVKGEFLDGSIKLSGLYES